MITGLHFDVGGHELAAHLGKRRDHHQERADWYSKRVDDLKAGGVEAANMSGGDPLEALRRKAKEHQHKTGIFAWMLEHIIPSETYRLGEGELSKLEIVSSPHNW